MNQSNCRNKLNIEFFIIVVLLISLSGCNVLRDQIPTPTPIPTDILEVTADQIAGAMLEDHFYADYNPYTLHVHGTISAVNQQGSKLLVELGTNSPMGVVCELENESTIFHTGINIIVSAQAKETQRTTTYVLLKNCILLQQ